jgi:hypothetical protein
MNAGTGKNVKAVIAKNVQIGGRLMTDGSALYDEAGMDYVHQSVDRSRGEWARGAVHVSTAEGLFSQLKRALDGTYHHVSEHHLHRYLAEFDYQYDNRKVKDGERTVKAIKKGAGKRLQYRDTKNSHIER